MSLKVPKANNVQLFKEGYKVRWPDHPPGSLTDRRLSISKASKKPFCATSRPLRSYQISYGRVSGQTVRRTTTVVPVPSTEPRTRSQQTLDQSPGSIVRHVRCGDHHQRGRSRTSSRKAARDGIAGPGIRGPPNPCFVPNHALMTMSRWVTQPTP